MRRACANNRKGEQSILPWKATPGCAGAKRSDTRAAPSCSGNRMPFRDSWTPPTLETWTGGSQQGGGSPGGDPCVWEGGGQRMSHGKRPGVAGGLISQANRPLARRSRWAFGGDLEGPSQSKLALEWWWWLAGGGGWSLGGGWVLTRVSELEILSENKTNNATGVERLAKMNLNGSATLSLVRRQSSHQMKYLGHPVNSHMAQPRPRSPTPTWSDAGLCF